jgi:hypothetical protein
LRIALALLIAAAQAPTVEVHTPPGSGEITLAYIEIGDGTYIDTFSEETPSEDGTLSIDLGRPIFAHSARIVRRFAGPRLPPDVVVHRIWRHASTGLIGRKRFLAFLERTDKGYYFVQWSVAPDGRRACMPAEVVEHYGITGGVQAAEGEVCLPLRD